MIFDFSIFLENFTLEMISRTNYFKWKISPFPLIRLNKASEKNGNEYMSMDLSDNGTNKINESTNLNNDNLIKDDIIRKQDEPHVSKIYRKNKLKNIEFNKKA